MKLRPKHYRRIRFLLLALGLVIVFCGIDMGPGLKMVGHNHTDLTGCMSSSCVTVTSQDRAPLIKMAWTFIFLGLMGVFGLSYRFFNQDISFRDLSMLKRDYPPKIFSKLYQHYASYLI